jgi:hypothetical protein
VVSTISSADVSSTSTGSRPSSALAFPLILFFIHLNPLPTRVFPAASLIPS